MAGTSVKKRVVIATVSTLLLTSPVELGLSDATTARIPGTFLPGSSVAWAAVASGPIDAGTQLSQAREYPEEAASTLSFTLTKIQTDPSEVLTEAELQKITEPYIGKTVSLADLYAVTGAINNLYKDKGYMVCKACLPPQRIHGGVVQIKLLEGKTGLVTLQGLKHTREKYVTARVPLKPGTVANTAALNKQLQRFGPTMCSCAFWFMRGKNREPQITRSRPMNRSRTSPLRYTWTTTATRLRAVSAREYSITSAV